MATKEQIEYFGSEMHKSRPVHLMKEADKVNEGIGALLKTLFECGGTATAGELSDEMNVSTARIANLLKVMEKKELITKCRDEIDGRITIVKITKKGEEVIINLKNDYQSKIGKIIDKVGEEKLQVYIDISYEILTILTPPKIDFLKED